MKVEMLSSPGGLMTGSALPEIAGSRSALAVVAHPDDESFGLGGVLLSLIQLGIDVRLLCLTAGEASTVGAGPDLAERRRGELAEAAARLGLSGSHLMDLADGALAQIPSPALESLIEAHLGAADLVVVFEPGGVTGHPDHVAATAAAETVAARRGLISLEWGLAKVVADALHADFGAPFEHLEAVGRWPVELIVDRRGQRGAISCHRSQDPGNPVLDRRLRLESDRELVWVRSAPYAARLQRFVELISPLAVPNASAQAEVEALRLLVGFAAGATWPTEFWTGMTNPETTSETVLTSAPGWRLLAHSGVVGRTIGEPADTGWGALATVAGLAVVEFPLSGVGGARSNQILIPRGGGYLYRGLGGRPPSALPDQSVTLDLEVNSPAS